jgi:hypothetical protein
MQNFDRQIEKFSCHEMMLFLEKLVKATDFNIIFIEHNDF